VRQGGDESIATPALEGRSRAPAPDGEIRGIRESRDVRDTVSVDRDAGCQVSIVAADVPAVDQLRTTAVDLGDEGIAVVGIVDREVRTGDYREAVLIGSRHSHHVGVTVRIHGDSPRVIVGNATDVPAVHDQTRVQDQGFVAVVLSELESVLDRPVLRLILEHEAHRHLLLAAVDDLVGIGACISETTDRSVDQELSVTVELHATGPTVAQANPFGIGIRTDHELVLHLVHGPLIDQVDARPQILVGQTSVGRDSHAMVLGTSLEVADDGGQPVFALWLDPLVGIHEIELHDPA